MRNIHVMMCAVVLCAVFAFSAEKGPAQESKIRIGILDLEGFGAEPDIATSASEQTAEAVSQIGFYEVYAQPKLEDALAKVKIAFPKHSQDPRSVLDIGRATSMDRMLFGSIEKRDKTYGVRLSLLDVQTKQTMASVSLQSAAGTTQADLIKAAVAKLHGHSDNDLQIKVDTYFGPQTNNMTRFGYASVACLGAGLLWAVANGAFKKESGSWEIPAGDVETGIPASADNIPMCARPAGLANSYLAVSDDAYGVLYNPAGACWTANPEMAVAYQYRFGALNNVAAAYVDRATRDLGFGEAFLWSGDSLSSEAYFISSAAYKFNRLLPFLRPLSVGGALKLSTITTPERQDGYSSQKTFGFGLDLGLLLELSSQIRYGLVLRDLVAYDKVNNPTLKKSYGEVRPATLNMGGMFKVGYTTLLVANGQIPVYQDQPWKMAGGIEQEFFRFLDVRVGIEKTMMSLVATPWQFTGGFGIVVPSESLFGKYLVLDASYEYNTLSIFNVVNASLRFGF